METPKEFYKNCSLNIDTYAEIFNFTKLYAQYAHRQIEQGKSRTEIICGFPGVGKSHYTGQEYIPDGWCIDSDSSQFEKKNFPQNYISHIRSNNGFYKFIFVSTHEDVLDALNRHGIYYTLVYPRISLKDEYLSRYKKRGNEDSFIKLIDKNWNDWIEGLQKRRSCKHIILQENQYLSNVI